MKLTIFKHSILYTILLFSCNSFAQIPIVWGDTSVDVPEDFNSTGNYYYKDIPNYLDNFVGTWEYVNGNEKFQIVLTKVIKYHQIESVLYLNFFEDGIVLQYKKYVNNLLTFTSPNYQDPNFRSMDGVSLMGSVTDYGRVTKTVYDYPLLGGGLLKQGGEYFYPRCIIEKLPKNKFEPYKIKFNLYLRQSMFGETNNEIYNGLPKFSIPQDIEMVKVN
jgi:hypothetical protein